MTRVVVTDASQRVALCVVRALGEAGYKLDVVEQKRFANAPICFYSRYITRRHVLPSIDEGQDAFLEGLRYLCKGIDILLPISINTLLCVLKHREMFESQGVRIPFVSYQQLHQANKKDIVIKMANSIGIPVPKTYNVSDSDQLSDLSGDLPLVIKLRDDEGLYLAPGKRYKVVRTLEELKSWYHHFSALKAFPIVQEYVQGAGYGCSALFEMGRPRVLFCHKRLHEYPPSGGPSSLCCSVYSPQMQQYTVKLLEGLKWHGIAMVEFRRDQDGTFKLMELNPRFWGSLPLAILAGINFPLLLCKMAMGQEFDHNPSYREGVRLRFISMEIASALALRSPRRLVSSILSRDPDGVFRRDDPRPALVHLISKIFCSSFLGPISH